LMVAEPQAIQIHVYWMVGLFQSRFRRILTHSQKIMASCANAQIWIHGGRWVEDKTSEPEQKTDLVSIIASKKNSAQGHLLRQEVINWALKENYPLDTFGYGYNPLAEKEMGHAPYRFSVVIENSQSAGYFTEKLIDAVLCRSIPIYWGDPEISQYFDTRGMIICNSIGEFIEALNSINNETYEAMAPYLEINRDFALATFDLPNSMTKIAGPHIYDKSVQFGAK